MKTIRINYMKNIHLAEFNYIIKYYFKFYIFHAIIFSL